MALTFRSQRLTYSIYQFYIGSKFAQLQMSKTINFGFLFKQILKNLRQNITIYQVIVLKNVSKNTVIYINSRSILIIVPRLLLLPCQKLLQLTNMINKLLNKSNRLKSAFIPFLQLLVNANKNLLAIFISILPVILNLTQQTYKSYWSNYRHNFKI